MSGPAQEIALAKWLAAGLRCIGQISIEARDDGTFALDSSRGCDARRPSRLYAHAG